MRLSCAKKEKKMAMVEWFLVFGIWAAAVLIHGQPGDVMTPTKSIIDGQTLISLGGTFELGFFSPGDLKNRYLGIYYKGTPDNAVVWVANRVSPLSGSTGALNLTGDGNLVLVNSTGYIFWSTGTSNAINPVVQLLDSGNLVLIEGTSKNLLWQSFDHPGNTRLPGMKLTQDLRTNLDTHLTSWKSSSDPSSGDYSYKINSITVPEIFLWRGSVKIYRTGPWNGHGFDGNPGMKTNNMFKYNMVANEYEANYTHEVLDNSILSRVLLNETSVIQHLVRFKPSLTWEVNLWLPKDPCDQYNHCGANGLCSTSYSSACDCLRGFSPKSPQNWRVGDNSDGCVRRTALNCSSGDGFFELQQVKLPDTSNVTVHSSFSLEECQDWCLKNCSCSAYAISEGSGCITWTGDLLDIRAFTEGGEDIYVRLASSELDRKRSAILNWQKRLDIILGIARGLLYLHQDSRLKIIHRDLKASNILLDEELNPKISDFGTARIFKVDQIKENTSKVVGTYGYMSPEYAMGGIFSVKSDVFSFGVLVLEILSGKKNRMINQAEACVNLLGHVWRLWTEGRCLEILDEAVGCAYPESKVLRCIQVALLCVQQGSEDRPTMAEVVLMLSTESALLPQPQKPGFCIAPLMERVRS